MKRILLVILVVGVLLLSACGAPTTPPAEAPTTAPPVTEPQEPEAERSSKYAPANISLFASATEGEVIRFYFLLEDVNGRNTPADGLVKIEIFDDLNNSLFHKEFNVRASEFVDYQFQLTGQHMGEAYEWRVPVEEIQKGISSIGWGRAVLTFATPDGKELHAEDATIQIPAYTDEELEQMTEEEYGKSAAVVNQKVSKGNFEVTVTKVGFFSPYEWGEKKGYFRVDMEVKNIGAENEYFSQYGMVILDNQGNQYEQTYGGTLDISSDIYPGVTKKGSILFEDVPETLRSVRLIFESGYDENFNPYVFEYNIQLK